MKIKKWAVVWKKNNQILYEGEGCAIFDFKREAIDWFGTENFSIAKIVKVEIKIIK